MSLPRRGIETGAVLHGTYEIVRQVGAGGMGDVYEARHTRLPGRFAIKVLAGVVGRTGGNELLRFRREAEIASSLRHPNIVQVVDFNHMEDGSPYIVMEFLEGNALAVELQQAGRFSPRRTLNIVEQIAAALAAAHARGIIHRDLKPQNVLLIPLRGKEGDFVKVVDFGISKVKTAVTLTDEARLLGTPQYMSPEQAKSRPDEVDGRTDQFALASMTYEMLTGRVAFEADSVPAVLLKITSEDPPPLTEVPPPIGPAAEAVLRKALAKDKEARFASILELADALAVAISGQPLPERARERDMTLGTSTPEARGFRADPGAPTVMTPQAARGSPAPATPERSRRLGMGVAVAAVMLAIAAGVLALRGFTVTPGAPPPPVMVQEAPPAPAPESPPRSQPPAAAAPGPTALAPGKAETRQRTTGKGRRTSPPARQPAVAEPAPKRSEENDPKPPPPPKPANPKRVDFIEKL